MDDELLKFFEEHGNMDLPHIRQVIEMLKRKEYLDKHPYEVWYGKDGEWHTYFPGKPRRKHRHRKTKVELEKLIADFWRNEVENPPLKEVFHEWNDRKLQLENIGHATHYRNEGIFKKHFSEWANRRIRSIKPLEFEVFLEEQVHKYNMTSKAFSNLKSIVRGMMRRAKKRGLIEWNYEYMLTSLDVTGKDFRTRIKEDCEEVFDEEETENIIRYFLANQDTMNLGLLFLFVSGLRVGELCALKSEDIEEDHVNIRRTETFYRGGDEKKIQHVVKDFPKTAAGWRTVVIPSDYEWLLRKLKTLNPWGEWVFMKNGKRIHERSFEGRLRRVCDELGIVRKSPHKIRKTYATILMDSNVDTNMIIQQMGHTTILTSERYYHRNRKNIDKKRNILDNVPDFKQGFNAYRPTPQKCRIYGENLGF